jgi:DNA-binding CsgD family transcriptional regulator
MVHVIVLGLVLTLVAGIASFAVLTRKVHAKPSRLPSSIPAPLLLYNVWIATWLVSQYLGFYVFPALSKPVAVHLASALSTAVTLVALAWLRAHVALIDGFLESNESRLASRYVGWLTCASAAVLVAGWGIAIADPALSGVSRYAQRWVSEAVFPMALGGSVLLLLGARREQDGGMRWALTVLSRSYLTLFSLLTALVLVAWRFRLASQAVLVSADLALELAYNVLTVVWVWRYADVFARVSPSDTSPAEVFDAQCEVFKISKRERDIIGLVCQGLTNQEIADRLFISIGTVKDHNYTIFQKTSVRNRTELAKLFTRSAGQPGGTRDVAEAKGLRRVV